MRDVKGKSRRQRRRKNSGCCLGRLIVLLAIFSLIGFFGYKAFQGLSIKTYFMQLKYPIKYQNLVEEYARENNLDFALVYGIINTESKFDPYAVSNAGAKGLMQLRDDTAKECSKSLSINDFRADMLFEPDINIRMGCYYFSKLLKKYNGETETALAAYNGGPGNVDKWLKDRDYSSDGVKLNYIPFDETNKYVKKVMTAYKAYADIYNLNEGVL